MVLRGALVREYFGRDSFGKIMGVTMGFAAFGGIMGQTLAGWTFDTLGTYKVFWVILSGVLGAGMILMLKVKKAQK